MLKVFALIVVLKKRRASNASPLDGFFMKQSELSNFLEIKDGNILLSIDKYTFALSPKAAGNMVVALRGALRLLTKRAADAPPCKHEHVTSNLNVSSQVVCLDCGETVRR